jgi:hypothetical protein
LGGNHEKWHSFLAIISPHISKEFDSGHDRHIPVRNYEINLFANSNRFRALEAFSASTICLNFMPGNTVFRDAPHG